MANKSKGKGKENKSNTDRINRVTGMVISISFRVILYALIVVLFYFGVTRAFSFGRSIFSQQTMTREPGIEMSITIEEGDSALQVGKNLEKMGLIHSSYAFAFQKYFYEYDLQPGTYTLSTAMTVKETLEVLNEGIEETEEADE